MLNILFILVSASSLNDQKLYQQQQQKLLELENQLEKFQQYDYFLSYQNQLSPIPQSIDNAAFVFSPMPPKCNPILSVQIQKRMNDLHQYNLIHFLLHRNSHATTRKIKTKTSAAYNRTFNIGI